MNALSKNQKRADNRARLRAALFAVLGDRCSLCGTDENLEIHHVDGCTWNQRTCNAEHRLYRYLRELREGVRLDVLCADCNKEIGRPEHAEAKQHLEEAPF